MATRGRYLLSPEEMRRLEGVYRSKLRNAAARAMRQTGSMVAFDEYDSAANYALALALRDFDPGRGVGFGTLLWTIVRSQFARLRGIEARRPRTEPLEFLGHEDEDPTAEGIADPADVWAAVRYGELRDALAAAEYGEEVLLAAEGYNLRERAEATGASRETVRLRRLRAAAEARESLGVVE